MRFSTRLDQLILNACIVVASNWLLAVPCVVAEPLRIQLDEQAHTLSVFRQGTNQSILTQNARPDHRPYLHPIVSPDGQGILTQNSPNHHPHQTGIYWGFTRVNGRDYFHHPKGDYWRRVSLKILVHESRGETAPVQWQTIYDLLDEQGKPILTETQIWTMRLEGDSTILDLQWSGEAKTQVTIQKYKYGGLFIRMPWREGIRAEVVNAARNRNLEAEGKRATWLDLGMQVDQRDDLAHIAIFDHPKNEGFPQAWRVDGNYGVGPAVSRLGDVTIEKGEHKVFKYQLRIYTGATKDQELTKGWSKFSGESSTGALWKLAQQEGRSAEFLPPQQAAEAMTTRKGFEVNVWAAEPMITQPMGFCWDDRGRLWIAENRDYENRNDGFSNSGDSRILILEDTDQDGVADSRKVFLEGIPFPAAIAVGFGGLWLGAPPNLLFVPDRDNDDRADRQDIEVRLTGWGIRDRHETINNLHWGPDGWLYGCQGFATNSQVGKPAHPKYTFSQEHDFTKDIEYDGPTVKMNGGVWRYHPTKKRFEVVAHGFSNPWGIDYDAKGQIFITACVIPHLWHVIPGGIYHRQGGHHFNPYVYSDIRTIADHRHRSAHGGARVYLSDAFPQRYHGQIFMANIHEHAVLTDRLEPSGSGFIGRHGEDFLLANNAQWVGFGIEIGPDGSIYVLDWHDADICGGDVLYKDTGRVFRIAPTESRAKSWKDRYANLKQLSDDKLVALQRSQSAWHARRARVLLQERAANRAINPQAMDALRQLFHAHQDIHIRLRAMWALHITGGLSAEKLITSLHDPEEYVRAWAIQFLCEDDGLQDEAFTQFVEMANSDPSPVIRLYLASALQRLEENQIWEIASALVTHEEDIHDHNIPKMLWYGIEPLVPKDPIRAVQLALASKIPAITQYIARRMSDGEKLENLVAAIGEYPQSRYLLLLGMRDSLTGKHDVKPPPSWQEVYSLLQSDEEKIAQLALQLAQTFGDAQAASELLLTLGQASANIESRRIALRRLSRRKHPELKYRIVELLGDNQLRREAIQAIAFFDDDKLANQLLDRYATLTSEEKLDAIHSLASRQSTGQMLTKAIQRGIIPKQDIPAYVARLLRRVVGTQFVDVWGPLDEPTANQKSLFAKYRALLTDDALASASPERGQQVFARTCMTCHKMHGKGGNIGPDITGANRTNLEYLLGNILTPNAVIQDAYKMHLVLTDEGRIYSGIPAGETNRDLLLRIAGKDKPVVLPKANIASREIASVSMMPAGILRGLPDSEVLDLFSYLMVPFL